MILAFMIKYTYFSWKAHNSFALHNYTRPVMEKPLDVENACMSKHFSDIIIIIVVVAVVATIWTVARQQF